MVLSILFGERYNFVFFNPESRNGACSFLNISICSFYLHDIVDIHCQYCDLLRLFESGGFPPHSNYLFLGDYVDRGKQSLETICLLLAYQIKFPNNFFLLRGNHESALIDERILCMHGGLSPDLRSFDQIRNLPRPTDVPDSGCYVISSGQILIKIFEAGP
ncbi:hypothetical protein SLEP1_g384 [Rubroshorea leprosula]|uniref:Serine/threonine-protein phosphatase n=1 Tax=Rubroshorea leprosula TaxID=152421 RepID=A0AAV5HG81_9ROSI|nr:hypothetical protein SLEP1_g384 [Rubroshorea leprosula]